MTLNSFFLILQRQFTQKWGRFLLASGGIMIGVWTISLTSGLSFGINKTIVGAINSQASIKRIDIAKIEGGELNITQEPTYLPFSKEQFDKDFSEIPEVEDYSVEGYVTAFVHTDLNSTDNCSTQVRNLKESKQPPADPSELLKKCQETEFRKITWSEFKANFQNKIIGDLRKPNSDEIISCFKCGRFDLAKKLGIAKPEDLIGKEIAIEVTKTSPYVLLNTTVKARNVVGDSQHNVKNPQPKKYKVIAVVDDENEQSVLNSLVTDGAKFYLDLSEYETSLTSENIGFEPNLGGYLSASVFAKDYKDLQVIVDKAKEKGYVAIAGFKILADQIGSATVVLSYFMGGFGIIALVASVFGIINLMTISVLERKKEIGILKSLGARDFDIFALFLMESVILGIIGWLLGMLLTLLCNFTIVQVFNLVLKQNESIRNNLAGLNITTFEPILPWYIILGTLALALIFTVISGVFPSIKASKQNPVEVLRSE